MISSKYVSSSLISVWLLIAASSAGAQTASPANESPAALGAQLAGLQSSLLQTQAKLARELRKIQQLQAQIQHLTAQRQPPAPRGSRPVGPHSQAAAAPAHAQVRRQSAHISRSDWLILRQEVKDLEQDKAESNLLHPLVISGIVLFNGFADYGNVDSIDVPTQVLPGPASNRLGAGLRQSIVSLSGFGPRFLGARTRAHIAMDFFGGLPAGYGATGSGLLRLRLARLRLSWTDTAITAGLDTPFFSPNAPTSYMSLAEPAFATAGNLWQWTPGVRIARQFKAGDAGWKIQAGILDPTEFGSSFTSYRSPTSGENSGQPAYAVRFSFQPDRKRSHPGALGISGVYEPRQFSNGTSLPAWALGTDWLWKLASRLQISGQSFWGRGLTAFDGLPQLNAPIQSYSAAVYARADAALAGLPMFGGWLQLRYRPSERQQFNLAAGYGGYESGRLRAFSLFNPVLSSLSARNQLLLFNYVYQPWSDIVISPEIRIMRDYPRKGAPGWGGQSGVALGFLF